MQPLAQWPKESCYDSDGGSNRVPWHLAYFAAGFHSKQTCCVFHWNSVAVKSVEFDFSNSSDNQTRKDKTDSYNARRTLEQSTERQRILITKCYSIQATRQCMLDISLLPGGASTRRVIPQVVRRAIFRVWRITFFRRGISTGEHGHKRKPNAHGVA
jgi:hypothetical protein